MALGDRAQGGPFQGMLAGLPGFGWAKDMASNRSAQEEQKRVEEANKRLAEALGLASQQYQEQRPVNSAARQEALRNMLGMYGPANEMMREMSGGKYALDLNAPAQRFPSPYNMQLAAQQAKGARKIGPPTGGAPGWGGLMG